MGKAAYKIFMRMKDADLLEAGSNDGPLGRLSEAIAAGGANQEEIALILKNVVLFGGKDDKKSRDAGDVLKTVNKEVLFAIMGAISLEAASVETKKICQSNLDKILGG